MDYMQFIIFIGSVIGFLVWSHRSLGKTIDIIHSDTNRMIDSIQQDMRLQSSRIDQQTTRMDQLYNMFIDLVKSKK